jgi:hypothetical protein
MTIRAIQWGSSFENVLVLGELYAPVTDREARDGSDFVQGPSGVEAAWITGRDYTLEADLRWIPDVPGGAQSPVSGPTAWQGFLDWARDKNAFRFLPDVTVPLFYVDTCYLVEPSRGFGIFENIKRTVRLKIRNATVDFHLALRGLMFEYTPGGSLTEPVAATFSRADARRYHNSDLRVATAAANTLRDRHFINGVQTTLLEEGRTNAYVRSQEFDNASWVKTNCTIGGTLEIAPDDSTTAQSWVESSDGAPVLHQLHQTLPALADNTNQSVSIHVRAGQRQWLLIQSRNKANAFHEASFNVATGTVGTVSGGASAFIEGPFHGKFGAFFYRCTFVWPSASGGTTPLVGFYIATGDGAAAATYTGSGLSALAIWGAQFETDQPYPSAYIATTTAAVAVGTDSLTWLWSFRNQAMFAYEQWIELSGVRDGDARLLTLGSNNFTAPYWAIQFGPTAGNMRAIFDSSSGLRSSGNLTNPGSQSLMEALAVVTPTGVVGFRLSVNGAADVVASNSGVGPSDPFFPFAFSAPQLRLCGGNGTGNVSANEAIRVVKVGPYNFADRTIDTIPKARLV